MRAQLYLDIQNKLSAIIGTDGLPVFKHFDLWNQNTKFIEEETPFQFPAIFIEFFPFTWQQRGLGLQQAEINIKIHVVTKWFANTAMYSPDQLKAIEYLDLPEKAFAALHCKGTTNTNGLMRTNSTTNHNHNTIVDNTEEYKTLITSSTAAMSSQTQVNNTSIVINNNPQS